MRVVHIFTSIRIDAMVRRVNICTCIASAAAVACRAIQLQLQMQWRSLNGWDSDARCTVVVCGCDGVPSALVRPNEVHVVLVASFVL